MIQTRTREKRRWIAANVVGVCMVLLFIPQIVEVIGGVDSIRQICGWVGTCAAIVYLLKIGRLARKGRSKV